MSIEVRFEYIPLASVRVYVEVTDDDDELVDPATSMTVDIYKPDGTKDVDGSAMTKISTGKYHYHYTLGADADEGNYRGVVWSTDGSVVSFEKFGFKVKR